MGFLEAGQVVGFVFVDQRLQPLKIVAFWRKLEPSKLIEMTDFLVVTGREGRLPIRLAIGARTVALSIHLLLYLLVVVHDA